MKIARFSRLGFILAASGSAVGLGNIWKFPYITGENGGGAFVLIYLVTVLLIGFSILIAEMLIGYVGRKDGVSCFESLAPKHKNIWKFAGFQSVTGLFIMTFYSVVIGWILNYIVTSTTALPASIQEAETTFTTMLSSDILTQLFYHTLTFLLITYILTKGIKGGIQRLNFILMPILIIILLGMSAYALTLDAFSQSLEFMFAPKWEKINSGVFITAIGHAFFTLSLGMGAILTYSASMPKNSNLVQSAIWITLLDTVIAIVAGLMLFTFLYEYGSSPAKGPGLVFISLPTVFYEMGIIGNFFAVLFFIALAFAGLTSAVSLVEPMIEYFIDRFKWSRLKASVSMGLFFYLFGIVALLSNADAYKEFLTFGSRNFFDWMDYITASIMLPLAGLVMALFIGYSVEKQRVESLLKAQFGAIAFQVWYFSLRYITPVAMILLVLSLLEII
ncbi:sodium-dependent transporter [Sulfurimonas sp.]|jgi:NSS family neurotransmitter:Na+ symporter|uniref:sodium-dependent transporter n=1 Tax=Sulfurimonas sp. TaxID=2022749 RepID=UPI0025DBD66A|nr:sodium-dependent transporter [Sulfurimonas sp.]MCK9472713.1 sodium-dependent transporter [Sulfurimonas sp.]MDD3505418.1 sodium-dependent transporter [Sulfurimonas sp.]